MFFLQKQGFDFSYHIFVLGMTIQSFDLVGMVFFGLQDRASAMVFGLLYSIAFRSLIRSPHLDMMCSRNDNGCDVSIGTHGDLFSVDARYGTYYIARIIVDESACYWNEWGNGYATMSAYDTSIELHFLMSIISLMFWDFSSDPIMP
ncbi:hypothetical protein EYC80_007223 [Monilinia laxa]|uniref:Uncharacterized protein n=1 Tax=Monilinia laxa TaxID=61186 RepID=A0A5N6K0P7_MONLA|nr:hypothetical protein EYC80_007223 [Monilinia laxa]